MQRVFDLSKQWTAYHLQITNALTKVAVRSSVLQKFIHYISLSYFHYTRVINSC